MNGDISSDITITIEEDEIRSHIEEDKIISQVLEDEIACQIDEERMWIEIERIFLYKLKLHLLFTDFFDADLVEI